MAKQTKKSSSTSRRTAGAAKASTAKKATSKTAAKSSVRGRSTNSTARSAARKSASGSRSKTPSRAKTAAAKSNVTTDHEEIQRWAEERGAHPASVKGTGKRGDTGMIRLDFPGFSGEESLQPISWEEFFDEFDKKKLALVYQEKTARGQRSNFNKLVSREE